jgi:quinol monooxygenase YgiN
MSKRSRFILLTMILIGTVLFSRDGKSEQPGDPKAGKLMHGLIGKVTAVDGRRDELIAILLEGTSEMPGCLSYVVAKDAADANALWITEVWESKESHMASLTLPKVQGAIARGKPLIAEFGKSTLTNPVGGHGLAPFSSERVKRP